MEDSTYHYKAEFHGVDGLIHTSFNDNKMEVEDAVIKAFNDHSSTTFPPDAWSGDHIGFTSGLGSISRVGSSKGKRSYAVNYLEASQYGNLKVLCEANVNSIILAGNKATGANFTIGGQEYRVWAKKEIIVCGGVVKSPQILELSGIGNPEVLRQAGVECKVENKGIGANLQDHIATVLTVDVKPGVSTLDRLQTQPEVVQAAAKQYTESGSGPLSNVFGTAGFVAFKTIVSAEEFSSTIRSIKNTTPTSEFHRLQLEEVVKQLESDTSANIQMIMFPTTISLEGIKHQSKLFNPRNDGAGLSFIVCGQYPVSRGSVHIVNTGKWNLISPCRWHSGQLTCPQIQIRHHSSSPTMVVMKLIRSSSQLYSDGQMAPQRTNISRSTCKDALGLHRSMI
jgi:choline dehydrogenase-like flavoprotein